MKKKIILLSLVLSGTLLIGCTGKTVDATEKIPLETENLLKEQVKEKVDIEEDSLEFYQQLVEDLEIIEIYDSSELTLEMLQNKDRKIIIEKCIGVVENSDGDGKILNPCDSDYDYISYKSVEDFQVGDTILTYFIYNPDTNFTDDILERFDYIIDHKQED